jgi:hypothetical protein
MGSKPNRYSCNRLDDCMSKFFSGILILTAWGCGPHHVAPIQVPVTKYSCINWVQTIAICDTQGECNQICKDAAAGK